ncbi:uncharacterized protein LOC129726743 [Wyeomyia smithii]|uniref:uncharacterized protein LOC129726743 n=1 Tax=Wyeomyia smithii TaxID=174621 RepID=UPI0024681419|nr:uncharacterized protein LOC129726743 [Wyeomyia smithii]
MKKIFVSRLLLVTFLFKPSLAFFGLSESTFFAPSLDIFTASSLAGSTCLSINSTASSLQNGVFNSLALDDLSSSFSGTFVNLYTQLNSVFDAIKNAAHDKKTSIDSLFTVINGTITNVTTFIANNNRTLWSSVLSSDSIPNINSTLSTIETIFKKLNSDIYPKLISIRNANSGAVSPATILATLPQSTITDFSNTIKQFTQFERTVTLPFVQSFVRSLTTANSNIGAYISTTSSSYSTLDATLSQAWNRASSLSDTYATSTKTLFQPVQLSTNSFIKLITAFTDLYLGSSTDINSAAVTMFFNSYISNATEQNGLILDKLDNFRIKLTDQVLSASDIMLSEGMLALENVSMLILQKINRTTCAGKLVQPFFNSYATLLTSLKDCLAGTNFNLPAPTSAQVKVASNIQDDVMYYLKMLNGMLTGVTNNSPATTRITTDAHLTAFFSQTNGIIQTFSQQLVNMYVQLGADYDLLVGRSSYCLAMKNTEGSMLVHDFVSAVQQC